MAERAHPDRRQRIRHQPHSGVASPADRCDCNQLQGRQGHPVVLDPTTVREWIGAFSRASVLARGFNYRAPCVPTWASRRPSRFDCAGSSLARSTKAEFGNRADRRSLHRSRAQSISGSLSGLWQGPAVVEGSRAPPHRVPPRRYGTSSADRLVLPLLRRPRVTPRWRLKGRCSVSLLDDFLARRKMHRELEALAHDLAKQIKDSAADISPKHLHTGYEFGPVQQWLDVDIIAAPPPRD